MIPFIHIMGATCSGKTHFMDYAQQKLGASVYCIEIGRVLRSRYPPSFFDGSNAPRKTEDEAWDIYQDELRTALTRPGIGLILVSGQPRSPKQARNIVVSAPWGVDLGFVMFHADPDVRTTRAGEMYKDKPEALELAMDRIRGDMANYFDVLCELSLLKQDVMTVRTNDKPGTYQARLLNALCYWKGPQ